MAAVITTVFDNLVPGWLALTLAVVLVVISQIKDVYKRQAIR